MYVDSYLHLLYTGMDSLFASELTVLLDILPKQVYIHN